MPNSTVYFACCADWKILFNFFVELLIKRIYTHSVQYIRFIALWLPLKYGFNGNKIVFIVLTFIIIIACFAYFLNGEVN